MLICDRKVELDCEQFRSIGEHSGSKSPIKTVASPNPSSSKSGRSPRRLQNQPAQPGTASQETASIGLNGDTPDETTNRPTGWSAEKVAEAIDLLIATHESVGGDVISAGGAGTFHLHDRVTEVQAGSYALMDTYYAKMQLPFVQACWVLGTVISATASRAVADAGLKAFGMDHGNPTLSTLDGRDAAVWFLSDEHVTFAQPAGAIKVGEQVLLTPAHIDPTLAMHEVAWLIRDREVIDRWPIDLRGWAT